MSATIRPSTRPEPGSWIRGRIAKLLEVLEVGEALVFPIRLGCSRNSFTCKGYGKIHVKFSKYIHTHTDALMKHSGLWNP